MVFDQRAKAKKYTLKDGDSLQAIAQRESTPGHPLTAADLARFNWGTDDPGMIDEFLRDELGCYRRGPDKEFIISADAQPRTDLFIPQLFGKSGCATDQTHTIRVKKKAAPPKQFAACARVRGVCFEFDKSFIRPSVVDDLEILEELAKKHPDSKIMIFGHTDKVGSEQYNQDLSQRRALSTYAFITNDADTWEKLYQEEHWGIRAVQAILSDFGGEFDPGPVDGIEGPKTKAAIKKYQEARGLTVDGIAGPVTRKKLFAEYMSSKHDVKLAPDRFLNPKYVGCSEFNPVVETEDACELNRRVAFFFFHKDRPPNFPCKPGKLAPCKKQVAEPLPRHTESFHCSFYDSISKNCPVEGGGPLPLTVKSLELVSVDDHFVPGAETLDVVYRLQGYQSSDTVTFEISSKHYADGPIFSKELTEAEKADGENTLQWDGRSNCTKGNLQHRLIHPLLSPYQVRVYDAAGKEAKLEFKVLYAGVKLSPGPWAPPDEVPTRADRKDHWVQLRINELGFFAGPVDGVMGPLAKAGIKQYKKYHTDLYTDTSDAVTEDLCDRLAAGDNQREIFSSDSWINAGDAGGIYLDCDEYYREYDDLKDPAIKVNHERDNLSRPCLPLKAEVQLLSKNAELGAEDGKITAPEAVGPVKIRWFIQDPAEDLTRLPDGSVATVPSRTQQYIQAALGVVASPGDNCARRFGGERSNTSEDHRLVFWGGSLGLLPFAAEDDAANHAYFTRAHADPGAHKDLLGCAMIIARPSYMTCDDYRFGAVLDFKDEANQSFMDGIYAGKSISALTGTLAVWRRSRVGAYVKWGQRNETNEGLTWANIAARFAECNIALETPAAELGRDDFMTLADYSAIVTAQCTNAAYRTAVQNEAAAVAGGAAATLSLDSYAVDFRTARLPGESNWNYGVRIGNAASSIWDEISGDIVNRLTSQLRPQSPMGLLVLDFKAVCPVQWRAATGSANDVPASRSAWADRHGITMIEIDINMNQDTLMAHEIGHNFYLSHWEVPAADPYRRPIDHDQNDHNCMMSYAWNLTGRADGVNANGQLFDGRFCGKCNLKLRGWNLSGAGLPASS
jgi:peptidoglycan hydrolase-like protein with peptidoglycan-binding domain